jgi:hypothetical protein
MSPSLKLSQGRRAARQDRCRAFNRDRTSACVASVIGVDGYDFTATFEVHEKVIE